MSRALTLAFLAFALAAPAARCGEGKLPPDLALLPDDTSAFLSVRVPDRKNPTALFLWDRLADLELLPPGDGLALIGDALTTLDLGIEGVERWTFAVRRADPHDLTVTVRARRPLDRAVLARNASLEEVSVRGRTFFLRRGTAGRDVGEREAVYLADERTAVVGKVKRVRWALADREPSLAAERALAAGHDFVLAGNLGDLAVGWSLTEARGGRAARTPEARLEALFEDLPAAALLLKPFLTAANAVVTLDVTGQFTLGVRASAADDRALDDAETAARAGLLLARESAPRLVQGLGLAAEDFRAREVARALRAGIEAGRVRREGKTLCVDVRATPTAETLAFVRGHTRRALERDAGTRPLKQIGLAFHGFHDTMTGLPAAAVYTREGKPGLSWRVALLPYLDEGKLYAEFRLDEPWDSAHNKKLLGRMPKVYAPPPGGRALEGHTHLRVFAGPRTLFPEPKSPRPGVPLALTSFGAVVDGTSNTLLAVEAAESVPWTKPEGLTLPAKGLPRLGTRPGSFLALFADGSVRRLRSDLKEEALRDLIDPADGHVLPHDLDAPPEP